VPDLLAELRLRSTEQLARRPIGVSAEELAAALLPVLSTPLGPITDDLALRDFPVRDRLTELDFEIPLAGGDDADSDDGAVTLGDVGDLVRSHLTPDDPLADYARRLSADAMSWQSLRGYLTGSLDAVFRLPGPRYVVADYKTNWLGPVAGDFAGDAGGASATLGGHVAGDSAGSAAGGLVTGAVGAEALSAWHYRPEALTRTMAGSDYPLQAMLYGVALHRYLRWRQPDYDPDRHLGGVLYLFVRGMCGAGNPRVGGLPCGVFGWRPPSGLVIGLSDLLDRGAG
jgi:exodeoxyribonuclease V beta subunit